MILSEYIFMNNQEEELYILRQKLAKTEARFNQVTKAIYGKTTQCN